MFGLPLHRLKKMTYDHYSARYKGWRCLMFVRAGLQAAVVLTATAPSRTYNHEGKVLDLRGFQGIAQTTERKTPSLSLLQM